MWDIGAALLCVIIFTYIAILEKFVMDKHDVMCVSLSRIFYMLLTILIVIIIYDPKVITSNAFKQSLKDPNIILVGLFTALGAFLYYWMLSSKSLNIMSMIWPVVMLLSIIGACLIFKESMNFIQWIGVILTFIGVTITLMYKS